MPDRCYVCEYVVSRPADALDLRVEHTLVWIAQQMLIEDLREAGGEALPLETLAVSGIGEPGPVTRLEPRHWYWALMTERKLVISLREGAIGNGN